MSKKENAASLYSVYLKRTELLDDSERGAALKQALWKQLTRKIADSNGKQSKSTHVTGREK